MRLIRTDKARAELQPGTRTLGLRERSLLLLADGRKSLRDLRPMFDGQGEALALDLAARGYLRLVDPATPPRPQAPTAVRPAAPAPAPVPPPAAERPGRPAPPPVAADQFEGKRSLATARMFLFDLCERMFARRDPARAEELRVLLRAARDAQSMLAAGRVMLEEVERASGSERADAISARLAMLLPADSV